MIIIENLDLTPWILSIIVLGWLVFINRVWQRQSLAIAHKKLDFLAKKLGEMDFGNDPKATEIANFMPELIAASRRVLPFMLYQGAVIAFKRESREAYTEYSQAIDFYANEIAPKYKGAARNKLNFIQRECFRAVGIYGMFGSPLAWVITGVSMVLLLLAAIPISLVQIISRKMSGKSGQPVMGLEISGFGRLVSIFPQINFLSSYFGHKLAH